jgi:hypothetical protein
MCAILAPDEIGAQIHMVLAAQHQAGPTPPLRRMFSASNFDNFGATSSSPPNTAETAGARYRFCIS